MKQRQTLRLIACAMAAFLVCNAAMCAMAEDQGSGSGMFGELTNQTQQSELTGQTQESELTGQTQQSELAGQTQQSELTGQMSGVGAETEAESEGKYYYQLTAEDIVRLDNGDAEVIFNDEGRVTFIRGRYSPEKVEDYEDAAESLNYVATLLGLTKGALYFCVYKGIDYTTGYTYYLFLQRNGDVTVVNASIKIYVDPDGYTAALSCSFDPEYGTKEKSEGSITAKEAEDIVREVFSDFDIVVYEDATTQAGIMENGVNRHVWSVYTNNPDMASGNSDQPYLQHIVTYDGDYRMNLPADTIGSPVLEKDDALEKKAKAMFKGYEPAVWKGEVRLHNGKTMELEVPVARSKEDGRYYLIDLDRKMMVADYREAFYGSGDYIISSSDDNTGWKDRELMAMHTIGIAYDYYADHGMRSVDGSGIPLLILSGVCEPDGRAIDNAFFSGYLGGFGVFAISDINDTVECLDIMAHEFTHGITAATMGGCAYVNEMGAINEAFSDIMGNLCELSYTINQISISQGKTTGQFEITGTSNVGSSDNPEPLIPDWRIGEMGGRIYRDMSDPIQYNQPAFVGDAYYCKPTTHADVLGNDYGGVHVNSSLLGSIAWVMNQHGLNYENQYSLWMTAMNMMTPKSDYDDILQALIFARKTYGYDEEIDTWLSEAFAERGLLENSHSFSGTWDGVSFADYNAHRLSKDVNQWKEVPIGNEQDGSGQEKTTGGLTGELTKPAKDGLTGQLSANAAAGVPEPAETEAEAETKEAAKTEVEAETEEAAKPEAEAETEEAAKPEAEAETEEPVQADAGQGNAVADIIGSLGTQSEGKDWLAGVGLDQFGKVTREGYGRVELNCAPEDMEMAIGMAVIDPVTGMTITYTCHDENGNFSLLLPEGSYYIAVAVNKGGSQTEIWAYAQGGSYEPFSQFMRIQEVEVKAGKTETLPMVEIT